MSTLDLEEIRERLDEAISKGDVNALHEMAAELHPSDLADLVESLEEDEQVRLLSALPTELASETLVEMEDREDLLAILHPEKGAELLHELAGRRRGRPHRGAGAGGPQTDPRGAPPRRSR